MKTLRLMMSALTILAVAACGGTSDDPRTGSDEFYEPEATPEATPEGTPVVPNVGPYVPLITLSADSVKPADEVLVDLVLTDPDGDAMTTACTAVLTSESPEFDVSGFLTKVSETQYRFVAPVTATPIGKAVVRCKADDGRGGESDLAESTEILIDNHVVFEPTTDKYIDICNLPKSGCKILLDVDLGARVTVPDPEIYIPDQVRGATFEIPHTDFVANVDLDVDANVAMWSLIDENHPSIQVTAGTDEAGLGYSLEILPYVPSGAKLTAMNIDWRWQVVALAANGMTKENLFAGTVLASGTLASAPSHVEVTVQDGLLRFSINGTVSTPAIAATNLAGSQVGFSARSTAVAFSNAGAILRP